MLGYANTKQVLDDIRASDEGFDANGRSYVYARLASRAGQLRGVTTADLKRYDDNIRDHLAAMNERRTWPITLRYFQYLAALYTEMFLDLMSKSAAALLDLLNKHVATLNSNRRSGEALERFEESDLKKLAFWMATGSGKTLLMHMNYRQYLHYHRDGETAPDNILLITPYEGLSQQHLIELKASGIPARRFDLNESGLFAAEDNTVRVIEITKLVSEKRGEGVSVPVEVFEGANLVFVDEGHKGSSRAAKTWRSRRDALAESGFTFEYSATFGQALTAARDDSLTMEYGKAIAFDYSYRYFYNDGYGKDFHILNLKQETTEERTQTLLMANLLSFYEQQLVFANHGTELSPYNLEQPLWVFVGSSVHAVRREQGKATSDVLTVARFFHRTLSDSHWATETLRRLLEGSSGLTDDFGRDMFESRYAYLRNSHGTSASALYQDILSRTLHTPAGGGLHIVDIRGSEGELGLKGSGSDDYFGLIYIGDTGKFKRLVGDSDAGITVEDDAITGSMFDEIGKPGTTIDVLIGARKFIEGWNSWRVSNMGLLNIGRHEGAQIIQLFGRGVRLRGRDMTLKRSAALSGTHPEQIGLLESLNIFAVRANYMAQFREYLEREGVPTEGLLQVEVPIQPNRAFLNQGLMIPRLDEGRDFTSETAVMLKHAGGISSVFMDVSATVQSLRSGASGVGDASASTGRETTIPRESLALVDWDEVYLSLIEHKERRGMDNLVIRAAELKGIMEAEPPVYRLVADESLVRPTNAEEWKLLQETVTVILRRYADKLYRRSRERWESNHLVYRALDETDANFSFNAVEGNRGRYIVEVPRSEAQLVEEIESLIAGCRALYEGDRDGLPRIHFDRHLYQPLLVEKGSRLARMSPPGLTESERGFVEDLREYWGENRSAYPDDTEVFLLRNQSKGAGIGFFENRGFYPDFILWLKTADAQRMIFVEPHGMFYEDAPEHSDKVQLHRRLRHLSETMRERSGMDVTLDSFIVSETPYETLRNRWSGNWTRSDFATAHILFPERSGEYDYLMEIVAHN